VLMRGAMVGGAALLPLPLPLQSSLDTMSTVIRIQGFILVTRYKDRAKGDDVGWLGLPKIKLRYGLF
jgi:hypothetical protein